MEDMKNSHINLEMATEGWQLEIMQDVDTGSNVRVLYPVNFLE